MRVTALSIVPPIKALRRVHVASLTVLALTVGTRALAGQGSPLTPFDARKAEAFLKTQLPCLGCHQLKGDGGRIGPDLTTVRERRTPQYIAAMVGDPQRTVPGSAMPRTAMPAATQALIVAYLSALPGNATAVAATAPAVVSPAANGAALYARWCAACHGASGKGDGPNAKFLPVAPAVHASREAMSQRSDDVLYDTIFGGGAIMNRSPRMPAFGATLSDAQIRLLVRHIRSLCRCEGPAWAIERTPAR